MMVTVIAIAAIYRKLNMPSAMLGTFHVLLLIFVITLQGKPYDPHFNNERTE